MLNVDGPAENDLLSNSTQSKELLVHRGQPFEALPSLLTQCTPAGGPADLSFPLLYGGRGREGCFHLGA